MLFRSKHIIKIDIRYFIAGVIIVLFIIAFLFYLSKTKAERERKKRIRRQQKRQFGTYSRLNMLYRLKRRNKRSSFKTRRRNTWF